ncbi:hypothetical protein MNQ95_14130 [Pseudoxanthomonas daejeonensis]|uniref:hypothetical protein n=1 Tax=Pseudoxanthomonas daejeonensis TaxID=266062 RepID=UPI001F54444A|nr:hypothetical protein [Pseudoxanthomonas daejeonensis]UNK57254.1 hypothetical protein MNQ95_14130 [Pseudoxanthomonas daejeonensis]
MIKGMPAMLLALCMAVLASGGVSAQSAERPSASAWELLAGLAGQKLSKRDAPASGIAFEWSEDGRTLRRTEWQGARITKNVSDYTLSEDGAHILQAETLESFPTIHRRWLGTPQADGSIVFVHQGILKMPYRMTVGTDNGLQERSVKLVGGRYVDGRGTLDQAFIANAPVARAPASLAAAAGPGTVAGGGATEAEIAVWGDYAGFIGQRWRLDIGSRPRVFEFSWIEPGQRMLIAETHLDDGSAFSKTTISRTPVPGELQVVNERKGLKTTRLARVQADGSLLFPKQGVLEPAMRISRRDGGSWVEQQLKGDNSVRMEYVYTALQAAGTNTAVAATAGAAPAPAVGLAASPAVRSAAAVPAVAPAPGNAAGSYPVRVISGAGTISGSFSPGVSGIDRQGNRYDCYLLQTQPGDRWEITTQADDAYVPGLVVSHLGLAHGPDCMANLQQVAGAKRREAFLTFNQIHSMTAGGGYYWFVPVGVPGRSYTLQVKRKPGKPGGGMVPAGAASIPAPLVAVDTGPAAPVLEDPAWRAERVSAVQAILARLEDRTLRTQFGWQAQGERAYIEWKRYLWGGKDGVFRIVGGTVNDGGVHQSPEMTDYRLDPATQTYRTVDSKENNEFLPLDADTLLAIFYDVDDSGRPTRKKATAVKLNPDGSQSYDGSLRYWPSDRDALAALVPELRTRQARMRADLARERERAARELAEQQARDEASGGSGIGRMLGTLAIATVGAATVGYHGGSAEQIMGGALVGATIANPDSAAASILGAAGQELVTGGVSGMGAASSLAGMASGGGGSYPTRPNLAQSACAGFTESNYQQKAVSGGGDQQLYAMCGQAFDYYTMYKRAIAQGYSEADANRTYAAHQQSAEVAAGYLRSHGAD